MKTVKKLFVAIVLLFTLVGVLYQHQEINQLRHVNTVEANKIENKRLEIGTRYRVGGLSMIVSEYIYNGKKNYVITTNLSKKQYYQVGANTDKSGRTTGVTIAYGDNQK